MKNPNQFSSQVNDAVEKIRAAVEAGDRPRTVLACVELDDAVLRVGFFPPDDFERFVELLLSPRAAASAGTWRILKCIKNNHAELTAKQREHLHVIVRDRRSDISDCMSKYMADELLSRTFKD